MSRAAALPRITPLSLWFFRRLARRYFRRHFRSVMLLHAERLRGLDGPLIVYGNHSSWWDPMLVILLGHRLLPRRRHYAPMEEAMLARYPIFRRLGVFGVEMNSPRGAARFLRTAEAVLRSNGVLWITPQGRFADPREPALAFKPGLAALALRVPEARLLPLAMEYTFWDERLPETLGCLGQPLPLSESAGTSVEEATRELQDRLAVCMRELRERSMAREAAPFEVILRGGRGTGGIYGLMRRLRTLLPGSSAAVLDHTERREREAAR